MMVCGGMELINHDHTTFAAITRSSSALVSAYCQSTGIN
jgi:hypothetical protein